MRGHRCKYPFTSFCVNVLITFLFMVLKNKFADINILDCNFLSSSYGNESHKSVGYGKKHAEYGPFLATDWLKIKGSGRVMS